MNLFDWLNQITYYKQPWNTFTDEDKNEFNTYMIHRFVSMNSNYIDIVNLIQRYPDCSKKNVYQFYCNLLPKQKAFFKYIKSGIKNDLETIIDNIKSWFQESEDYNTEFTKENRKFQDPNTLKIVEKSIDVIKAVDKNNGNVLSYYLHVTTRYH